MVTNLHVLARISITPQKENTFWGNTGGILYWEGCYFGKYPLMANTNFSFSIKLAQNITAALWGYHWPVWRVGMIIAMLNYFSVHIGIWVLCREGFGKIFFEPILIWDLTCSLFPSVIDKGQATMQRKQCNILESRNSWNINFKIAKNKITIWLDLIWL